MTQINKHNAKKKLARKMLKGRKEKYDILFDSPDWKSRAQKKLKKQINQRENKIKKDKLKNKKHV